MRSPRRRAIFDAYILGSCMSTSQHVAHSTLRHAALEHDPLPAAAACRTPTAYISADAPIVALGRDLERLEELCPQLVTAKTMLAGRFSTLEVADQADAMIERFLTVGMRSR
jgi:hypothetical protein